MSNTRRNYLLAIIATVFVVLLLLFWGLCYEKPADKDDAVMDREFARLRDSIYTNPHFVLETVGLMQSGMADSAKYYRLEMLKASVAYYQGDNSVGDEVCDRILEYCHRKGDTELELQFWNYHGNYIMLTLGLRDSAKACYSKAYKLLSDRSSASWKVNISINLADACRLTGNPAEASHYYRRALRTYFPEEFNNTMTGFYIKITCRFVCQNKFRLVQDCPGYYNSLLFASGQFVRHLVSFGFHPYLRKYLCYSGLDVVIVFPSGCFQYKFQIFFYRTVCK